MNNIFLKLQGSVETVNQQSITVSQFLNRDPKVTGYSTGDTFIAYARSLRPSEVEQLEQFFNYVRDDVRIVGSLITRTDRGNRAYMHPTFLVGRSTVGTKLILEGGMREFLKDYIEGKVKTDFSLEELVEAALND